MVAEGNYLKNNDSNNDYDVNAGTSKAKANAKIKVTFKKAASKERVASARDPTHTSAPSATKTVTRGSGYTVLQDAAQIPSANHRLFETRMP